MSTHLAAFAPGNFIGEYFKRHKQSGINVFLQHGITHNEFPSNYFEHNGSDLFICGAQPEYDHISNNCHYPKGQVAYTGFSRFDEFHSPKTRNQVLIMPTWRNYLRGLTKDQFKETPYFKAWDSLLRNNQLNESLEKQGLTLVFYIHYSLQQYSDCFSGYGPNVVVADFDHYDVQTLLKESKLLITDYSSIAFDFAYMRKPLLYYQFDYEGFYGKHYKHSYFSHESDGFGAAAKDEKSLVPLILQNIAGCFKLEAKYEERIRRFFPLFDADNSKRIFKQIVLKQFEKKRARGNRAVPHLIFAGDDYGRNHEASKGIEEAFKSGVIQQSTMIVNKYDESLIDKNFVKTHPIGLHLNIIDSDIDKTRKGEIKDLKHLEKVFLSKLSYFFLKKADKALIAKYAEQQFATFVQISDSKFWDSHGHTHTKLPILKVIIPIAKKYGITHARLSKNLAASHSLFNVVYKRAVNRLIRKNFKTHDYFGSVDDLFRAHLSNKKYQGKTIEIMTHPFINEKGELVNRNDYGFDLISAFLQPTE